MCPLILKLLSVIKLLILTAKLLVNIKTQDFYSGLLIQIMFFQFYRSVKQQMSLNKKKDMSLPSRMSWT